MSDQQYDTSGQEPQQDEEQLTLIPTLEDRIKAEATAVLAEHDLVDDEGKVDLYRIADLIYPTIKQAVVEKPGDRAVVGVTPTQLVTQFFPEVPGPLLWAEYEGEEAELREGVYTRVKQQLFRVLNVNPEGVIQSRLGENGGMVLCRTPKKGGREEMAYVTRNRACIDDDNNQPALAKAAKAMAMATALTELSVKRVPEHGRFFSKQHNTAMRKAIDGGKITIKAALEASTDGNFDDDGDDGDE
jgi:hypothetical protein